MSVLLRFAVLLALLLPALLPAQPCYAALAFPVTAFRMTTMRASHTLPLAHGGN